MVVFISELQTFSECYAANNGLNNVSTVCEQTAITHASQDPFYNNYYCE